jgi:hypothetical protein
MTPAAVSVAGMSTARRIEIGSLLSLAVAGLAVAVIGTLAAATGAELPVRVESALSSGMALVGWLRWLVVAALLYGVVKARENG